MRTLSSAVILLACVGLALLGCTDKSQSVVAPTDQAAPLGKSQAVVTPTTDQTACAGEEGRWGKVTHFTAIEHQGTTIKQGTISFPDADHMTITGMVADAAWESDNKLVSGYIVMTLNGILNVNTGEGSFEGTFTVKPVGGHGGVWKGKCKGIRTMTNPSIPEWTSKWDEVAQGKGGKIDGMQLFSKEVITSWADQSYTGTVEGYYIDAHKGDGHDGHDHHD